MRPPGAFRIVATSQSSRRDDDDDGDERSLHRHHRGIGSASTPDDREDDRAWYAGATGSAAARNAQLMASARFVREGESSRPWSGSGVAAATRVEEEGDEKEVAEEVVESHGDVAPTAGCSSSATSPLAAVDDAAARPSMAELYAQLAARARVASGEGGGDGDGGGGDDGDDTTTGRTPAPSRKRGRSGDDDREGDDKGANADGYAAAAAAAAASTQTSDTSRSAAASPPLTVRCPTCKTPLPNPCPADVLRTHLSSLAHRLAVTNTATAGTAVTPTEGVASQRSNPSTSARLHLDAQNRGYVLLAGMGWKEGAGLGVDEWRFLEGQREEQQEREESERREEKEAREQERRRREQGAGNVDGDSHDNIDADVISIPDDSSDDERRCGADDVFAAPTASPTTLRDARPSSSSPPAAASVADTPPPPPPPRRNARLVPITPSYKNDRRGLGTTTATSTKTHPRHRRRHLAPPPLSTPHLTQRQREERAMREREEMQRIRASLR